MCDDLKKIKQVLIYATALILLVFAYQKVEAMSIFDAGKVCVFSEVKAQLTRNGEPLRNVKVIRRWEWNSLKEESTTTDENGYFEFPAVYERSITRFMPVELVIAQGLYVVESDQETEIWIHSKREPEENAEFSGKPISLVCELTNEMEITREYGAKMLTLCVWEDQ